MPHKISSPFAWLLLLAGLFSLYMVSATPCRADDAYTSLLGAANQLLKDGKLPEARQTATTATSIAPDRFEAYVIAGVAAHQQGADADARPLIEKALALAPDDKKPKIQKFLDTLGSAKVASAVAGSAPTPTPTGTGPPSPTSAVPQPIVIADLDLKMMGIPAGSFTMGSPDGEEGRESNEGPQVRVTLSKSFWMGRTEMTQAQWEAIMGTDVLQQRDLYKKADMERRMKEEDDGLDPNYAMAGEGPKYPMYYVSWDDAMEYCRRLTERERAAGRLPEGYQYTLPTEAQWEYACRAGTDGPDAGDLNALNAMAWYDDNSGKQTHEVATKAENNWGLCDMHGNVSEWCLDYYDDKYYSGYSGVTQVTNPVGPTSGSSRVVRGGSWAIDWDDCRSAFRYASDPGDCENYLGFRIALVPSR
jgi:formylglycine-generating enzyme required for sulfatase activity